MTWSCRAGKTLMTPSPDNPTYPETLFKLDGRDRPACRVCGDPVGWQRNLRRWGIYCGGNVCRNPIRTCRHCERQYDAGQGRRLYCSRDCMAAANSMSIKRGPTKVPPAERTCHKCGRPFTVSGNAMRANRDLCKACVHPIRQAIATYRLNTDQALLLLAVTHCDLCGDPLEIHEVVVDHDHACCPGRQSCGRCVRGYVHHSCNVALGAGEHAR